MAQSGRTGRLARSRGSGHGGAGALEAFRFGEGILIRALAQGDGALESGASLIAGDEGLPQGNTLGAIGADGGSA